MSNYVCSECGAAAYYDGRCGDGPILTCGCNKRKRRWVDDGRGGYYTNPPKAEPIEREAYEGDDYNRGDDRH